MADHDNDIDGLLRYLLTSGHTQYWNDDSERWSRALTALVAERNRLKQRVAVLESQEFTLPTDPFRDPDRDLRERLVCAIWPQMLRSFDQPSDDGSRYEWQALKAKARNEALDEADKMIAAMRKQGGGA